MTDERPEVSGRATAGLAAWLDDALGELIKHHQVPGVSVAVVVDGATHTSCAGVINQRTQVPVTPDALFMIQSVTKVLTATLVMQLVDRGVLDLDAPVRSSLSSFRTSDEDASARITPRHLLTHTGGFEGDLWLPTTTDRTALTEFVDRHVATARQLTEPGQIYSYCSAGFGVLGRLVEVLTGMPFEDAFRTLLAEPLDVDELAFSADQALAHRTAIGHDVGERTGIVGPLFSWAVMPPSNHPAGNQLAMSARGLLRLARLHLDRDASGRDDAVLSTASVRAMRHREVERPAWLHQPAFQGLGWMLPGEGPVVEHGGDTIGSSSLVRLFPDRGAGIALLANSGTAGHLFDDVIAGVATQLGWPSRRSTVPALTPPGAVVRDASRYVGRYRTRTSEWAVSRDREGRLLLAVETVDEGLALAETARTRVARGGARELRHAHGHTFAVKADADEVVGSVEFIGAGPDGRAAYLHAGRLAPRHD